MLYHSHLNEKKNWSGDWTSWYGCGGPIFDKVVSVIYSQDLLDGHGQRRSASPDDGIPASLLPQLIPYRAKGDVGPQTSIDDAYI